VLKIPHLAGYIIINWPILMFTRLTDTRQMEFKRDKDNEEQITLAAF
jgi:hypothetical protein